MLHHTMLQHEHKEQLDELKKGLKDSDDIIIFFKQKCKFCEYIMPHFDKLIEEFPDIGFHKVDITFSDVPAKRMFNFWTIPTVIHLKNGKEMFRHGSEDRTITYQQMKDHVKKIYEQ